MKKPIPVPYFEYLTIFLEGLRKDGYRVDGENPYKTANIETEDGIVGAIIFKDAWWLDIGILVKVDNNNKLKENDRK